MNIGTTPHRQGGFTIVELLIVVVVIAILAAITVVSYNGIVRRATVTALQSDLSNARTQIMTKQALDGTYPNPSLPADIKASEGNSFQYTSNGTTFCITVFSDKEGIPSYYADTSGTINEGTCPGHSPALPNGTLLQNITNANCSTTRIRAVDARDNRTYWVQKLADGQCWMLTNLAYAGGGTNTFSDTKTLQNGTGDGSPTYTEPKYYVPTDANPTTEPTAPSTSTDAGQTNPQYGYLYNWCAAKGAQTSSSACAYGTTPAPADLISVCPAGWRLPNGGSGGQFQALNTAVNGGATNTNAGLRTNWLIQNSGYWFSTYGGFIQQGTSGMYWANEQTAPEYANYLYFTSGGGYDDSYNQKNWGMAVRCIAV